MNFLNYSAFWLARAFGDVRIIEPNRKCHRIDKMWEKSHWFFFESTLSMDYVEWKTSNFVTLNRTNAKYELYRSNERVWSSHIVKTTINVFLGKIFFKRKTDSLRVKPTEILKLSFFWIAYFEFWYYFIAHLY